MVSPLINSYTQAFAHRLTHRANAWAAVRGGKDYPNLLGTVKFFQTQAGVLVMAEIWGLPPSGDGSGVFAFHIHEGESCTGNETDEFADTRTHLNPSDAPHPQHMGDLPPLFSNRGYAWSAFLTSRFTIRDILNRTVVIHSAPDDFTTQPSGNSGVKIACGVIR